MQEIKTLIDKASKICGSDAALARSMGIAAQTISNMRNNRTITPETAAELADIAGENAIYAAISAMILRAKGTRREKVLLEILGKGLSNGVVVVWFFSQDDALNYNKTHLRQPR